MTDFIRPDGKPVVFDKRGAVPRYVIEDDEDGCPVVCDQLTGAVEMISERRPYANRRLMQAMRRLRERTQ